MFGVYEPLSGLVSSYLEQWRLLPSSSLIELRRPIKQREHVLAAVCLVSSHLELMRLDLRVKSLLFEPLDMLEKCYSEESCSEEPIKGLYLECMEAEMLPWLTCVALISGGFIDLGVCRSLLSFVTHKMSDVRLSYYYMAWLIRKQLPKQETLNALFKNLADTLGFLEVCAGLAYGLCENEEEFFSLAEAYTPPIGFEKQYQGRIAQLKSEKLCPRYLPNLYDEEIKVRDFMLGFFLAAGVEADE